MYGVLPNRSNRESDGKEGSDVLPGEVLVKSTDSCLPPPSLLGTYLPLDAIVVGSIRYIAICLRAKYLHPAG